MIVVSGVVNKMNNIKLTNVSTHNLKKIDVEIHKNKITSIYGRSGAGKSSLAFATLYQLCRDEFNALENGYTDNSEYYIQEYQGTIPAVAISQGYKNNNPRSTLYSYLNLPQILSTLSFVGFDVPEFKKLKLNRIENECPSCKGKGILQKIDNLSLVDFNKAISEKPFSLWKTGSFANLYHSTLLAFCELEQINIDIPFKNLPETEKYKVLHGCSEKRLDIKFKYRGSTRSRRVIYEGMMIFAESKQKKIKGDYVISSTCPDCFGSKVNYQYYKELKIQDISMVEFLVSPFSELLLKLQHNMQKNTLTVLLTSLCDIGLGYLHFSRSMPSLSGGELQKLRFSRLLTSNISGVLFVIDEISSQLSPSDFPIIFMHLKKLAKNNTVVLVEHAKYFIDNSDYKIHIGLDAGDKGGYICKNMNIVPIKFERMKMPTNDFITFSKINKYNIVNQSVSIPKKRITVFTGLPGSGKSSLARAIDEMGQAIYISQKFSSYNNRSILANTLKINNYLSDFFAKETGISSDNFILSKGAGCKTCNGTGAIKYERGYDGYFYTICNDCEGNLFNKNNHNLQIKVNGLTIIDFYQMNFFDLYSNIQNKKNISNTLLRIVNCMVQLELGHLQLIRKTQTLSGGEMRRVKLCEHLYRQKETKKILIMDEPVVGLDPETASKVAKFIFSKVSLFGAIIMIEHREEIIDLADYQVKIGPLSGPMGGKVLSQEFLA